jgi:F420-non-reducing hydrogenase iron-sulfur subunit
LITKKIKNKTAVKKPALKILVFACSRTVESIIGDDRMHLKIADDIPVIPIMCSGRMSSAIILKAIEQGADGVLVAGCNPDECRFGFGAKNGVATVVQAQRLLHILGIGKERVRFSGGKKIEEAYKEYSKQLKKHGNSK